MLPRFPILIWRMLALELLRGVTMATGAIVLVVAFGATIKPVAEGSIGALDAVKFMGIAVVPMLQYALPFGACMAATLGYHRFATDNEAVAARAGGIGYGALIAPALVGGILLGALLLALTGLAAPRFTRTLESIVTKDAARTLIRQIERGQPVVIDDMILHADEAFHAGAPENSGAIDYFILEGVVAAAVDPATGELTADVGAQRADVWLYPAERDGQDAVAVYMLVGGGVAKQEGEALLKLSRTEFGPWIIPGALGDDLDYMTDRELADVANDPESFGPVVRRREDAAAVLGAARARGEALDAVANEGRLTLVDPDGGRLGVSDVRAGEGGRLYPREGADYLAVTWRRSDGTLRQLRAESATLSIKVSPREKTSVASLELFVVSSEDDREGRRDALVLGEAFTLPLDPAPGAFELSAEALIAIAGATTDPELAEAGRRLAAYLEDVRREATANRHERAALSLAGFIMTPLGAIMALRLRDRIPLHVYLWSFFPALACVIIASGGASVTEENGDIGLYVIWAGCGGFALFALFEFWRLRRR